MQLRVELRVLIRHQPTLAVDSEFRGDVHRLVRRKCAEKPLNRIANADDYLQETAVPDNPPSGTKYKQAGKRIASLGVFEHWHSDATRQCSRNLDPLSRRGIELIYLPRE